MGFCGAVAAAHPDARRELPLSQLPVINHEAGNFRAVPGQAAAANFGIDARDGYVATGGWLETSSVRAVDLARAMAARGVHRVVATDIARDGARTGPNVAFLADVITSGLAVIASGGVKDRGHLATAGRGWEQCPSAKGDRVR